MQLTAILLAAAASLANAHCTTMPFSPSHGMKTRLIPS